MVHRVHPDWIFHLAAYGAYSSQTDLALMVKTNVIGTMNLVQASLRTGFEAFVNTGSSSEVRRANALPHAKWSARTEQSLRRHEGRCTSLLPLHGPE